MLAWLGVAAALQQVEALTESVEDLRGSEHPRASGGELDRKREVVEPFAEFRDLGCRFEPRALAEERDRVGRGERRH